MEALEHLKPQQAVEQSSEEGAQVGLDYEYPRQSESPQYRSLSYPGLHRTSVPGQVNSVPRVALCRPDYFPLDYAIGLSSPSGGDA